MPVGRMELNIAERQGIEIDYCSQCRGIWIDRAELDKITEQVGSLTYPEYSPYIGYHTEKLRDGETRGKDGYYDHKKRRRKSFLGISSILIEVI